MTLFKIAGFVGVVLVTASYASAQARTRGLPVDSLRYPEEKHLRNIRQLTFAADNAEAYWSFDGKMISFQSNNPAWGLSCDQVFYMPAPVDLNSICL